jgi:TRAP-type C4-dicarboxylate transport system permease small subunit
VKILGGIKSVIDKITEIICVIILAVMTCLVTYQVFTRYVLNSPSAITEALSQYLFVWMIMFGSAYVFGVREHLTIDLIRDKFPPMVEMIVEILSNICLFGFIGVLNEYMICLLLIPTGNAMSLGVGLARAIKALQYVGNYPAIFSAVIIAVAPSIIIYAICSRKIVFGGMGGGIKG